MNLHYIIFIPFSVNSVIKLYMPSLFISNCTFGDGENWLGTLLKWLLSFLRILGALSFGYTSRKGNTETLEIGDTCPVSHGIPKLSRRTLSKSPISRSVSESHLLPLLGAHHKQCFLGFAAIGLIICFLCCSLILHFSAQQEPFLTPHRAHFLNYCYDAVSSLSKLQTQSKEMPCSLLRITNRTNEGLGWLKC